MFSFLSCLFPTNDDALTLASKSNDLFVPTNMDGSEVDLCNGMKSSFDDVETDDSPVAVAAVLPKSSRSPRLTITAFQDVHQNPVNAVSSNGLP